MDYLRQRMDAGIGAASAYGGDRMTSDPTYSGFNRILHAATVRLRLPSAKAAAIVFDARRNSQEQWKYSDKQISAE